MIEIYEAKIKILRIKSSQASMNNFSADLRFLSIFLLLPKAIILSFITSLFIPFLGSTYKRFNIWLWTNLEINNLPFFQPNQFPQKKSFIVSNRRFHKI